MECVAQDIKRLTIRSNWDIEVKELTLKEHLENCEIWGDLNFSIEEHNIKNRIASAMSSKPSVTEIINMFRKYPVTMVSDIINFVLLDKVDF